MNEDIKVKIILTSIDLLFTKGLPALERLITSLNKKDKITIEDVEKLKGDLDAESYFE